MESTCLSVVLILGLLKRMSTGEIGEVNEIVKDLAVLVNDQGVMIDDISSNIDNSHAATAQATAQLRNSSLTCLLILIFGIVLLIVIIVVLKKEAKKEAYRKCLESNGVADSLTQGSFSKAKKSLSLWLQEASS
ncbi:hypothetical protein Bca52824_004970 [Brassica carinata]|uniref:t-SNARE coiled-coil homology domain-containing protein n=1 Tax=Brassica carinata TaxID=52824 RepID=A0A8X8BG60_BRACI|nr:hypothetical protein Bca52824_004970 [Brassica carinata]